MTLQSTGGTFATLLEPNWLPTAIRKGIVTAVFVRDYLQANGQPNNLASTSAGLNNNGVFTPFALDGTLRSDLLYNATAPNQGFYDCGLLKDDGWSFEPNLTVDQTAVAQSPWSARNDVTKISGKLTFALREWTPLSDYLSMDLPTVGGVPDLGTANYSIAAPAYQQLCERQFIVFGFDGPTYFAVTITRASQSKLGKIMAEKKNPADHDFDYEMLIDPMTNAPYIISFGGPGWTGLGGAPSFPATPAPTATPVTGLKVTITFPQPTGMDVETVTYTATKTTAGTTTPLTLQGSPTVAGGIVTLTGTGLTANAVYSAAQVTATADNNATAVLAIPGFTATAS